MSEHTQEEPEYVREAFGSWNAAITKAARQNEVSLQPDMVSTDDLLTSERAREHLISLAEKDQLTGWLNRRGLNNKMVDLLSDASKRPEAVAIYLLDINNLKQINDVYGHHEGDVVIQHITQRLGIRLPVRDINARYGGEEFVIIHPISKRKITEAKKRGQDVGDLTETFGKELAKTVNEAAAFDVKKDEIAGTASIGGMFIVNPTSTDAIYDGIKRADVAMYIAKNVSRSLPQQIPGVAPAIFHRLPQIPQ